jgi:hypothetical protein
MKNTKTVAAAAFAALALILGACSHRDTTTTANTDYGQVRTDNAAAESTPAVIAGPAKVDSDGRVYTSSSVGSTGNASNLGTNTNVSIIPEKPKASVTVTTTPVVVETELVTPPPPPVVIAEVEPPPPPPAVVIEPPPLPEPPMISATTERVRMSKD